MAKNISLPLGWSDFGLFVVPSTYRTADVQRTIHCPPTEIPSPGGLSQPTSSPFRRCLGSSIFSISFIGVTLGGFPGTPRKGPLL